MSRTQNTLIGIAVAVVIACGLGAAASSTPTPNPATTGPAVIKTATDAPVQIPTR